MTDDTELLRRFAASGDEEAFAELVRRRLGLVYSVAVRQVGGDTHLAQDIAQFVFTALARKARTLDNHLSLGGWLYRSTQFAASDAVRAERRRRAHEREIQAMQEIAPSSTSPLDWEKLRPLLDETIGTLPERDRNAICLRFFDQRSYADIGARLRLSENAARMRVNRALAGLQTRLARRGVTSTAAALAVALPGQAGASVPAGLATTLSQAALASAHATLSGTAVGWTLLSIMTSTKATITAATIVSVAAIGTALRVNQKAAIEVEAAQAAETAALERVEELEQELADFVSSTVAPELKAESAPAPPDVSHSASSAPETITRDYVRQRLDRARALARDGHSAAALEEFLWCYDVGTPQISSFSGVRAALTGEIAILGEDFPAALDALRQRRDLAEQRFLGGTGEFEEATALRWLNRALDESERNLRLYDSLPANDQRREELGRLLYDEFVETQRYEEAAKARPFNQMSSHFEMFITRAPARDATGAIATRNRRYAIENAATDVEVLAATGDFAHAAELALRVLEYDDSPETVALLKERAARAGRTGLIETLQEP